MLSTESVHLDSGDSQNHFTCKGCPYQYPITKTYLEKEVFERKQQDDVMGGEGAWDNVGKLFRARVESGLISSQIPWTPSVRTQIRNARASRPTSFRSKLGAVRFCCVISLLLHWI
jgi:hypothetical protein